MKDRYSLTLSQYDIWVDQQINPNSPLYNIGGYIEIKGPVRYEEFNKCITHVIDHNDALRIKISEEKGIPYQTFTSSLSYTVPAVDFSQAEDPFSSALQWMQERFKVPFDFDSSRLFEISLLKISDNHYLFFNKYHHIVVDGWGLSLIAERIIEGYNSLIKCREIICEHNYSYIKNIDASNDFFNSSRYCEAEKFWKNKFSTPVNSVLSSSLFLAPESAHAQSRRKSVVISASEYKKLKDLGSSLNVTTFNLLLGTLYIYFHKITKMEDLVIGIPLLNRHSKSFRKTVGLFVDTSPLWVHIEQNETTKEVLTHIAGSLRECYRYQKLNAGAIENLAGLKHSHRLFDIVVSFEKHFYEYSVQDYETDFVSLSSSYQNNALTLHIEEYQEDQDVVFNFDYRPDIFGSFSIDQLTSQFQVLLGDILANPDREIASLHLLTSTEEDKVIYGFNQTRRDFPFNQNIVELFENQVKKTPHAPAVMYMGNTLSFRELNQKANTVACYLKDVHNIKENDLVGLLMDRSDVMVIALWGILKSGAAYVPVDPGYPQNRIDYILEDSKPKAVISDCERKGSLNIHNILQAEHNNGNPPVTINGSSHLYVIYTSGTTGNPKGTVISHHNYINYISWAMDYYFKREQGGHFPLFTSVSFDLTTTSIYLSLLRGKTLKVFPQDRDVSEILMDIFSDDLIDSVKLTPSHISLLSEFDFKKSGIRLAIVGGEELLNSQVQILKKINPQMQVINEYGPTETTVGCIAKEICDENEKILIGKPIANTKVFILNNGRPEPVCIPGEIAIGGEGVSSGYLRRGNLTAEKFIPNPFCPGERIYLTGDLGRWLPDGNIEYLGRKDDQVKLRGYRLEPGEIENALLKKEGLTSAAAVIVQRAQGLKDLCVYYTGDREYEVSVLRSFMAESLPDYLIPNYFMRIESLPLTVNGKVDKSALPDPVFENIFQGSVYAAPEISIEVSLVRIWQKVLGLKKNIGIDDNFFELGGDSIKAIQVMSGLKTYGLTGEVAVLFKNPTIREFAPLVHDNIKKAEQGPVSGFLPLTPVQKWFFKELDGPKHHYNQSVLLNIQTCIDDERIEDLKNAARELIAHHDALRIRFVNKEGEIFQENRSSGDLCFKVYDFRKEENTVMKLEETAEALQSSFDLENDILIRFALFRLQEGVRLFITAHHLVIDGVSWRILLEDLETGFQQAGSGENIILPSKSTSFKEWSFGLSEYATNVKLKEEALFWENQNAFAGDNFPYMSSPSAGVKRVSTFRLDKTATDVLLSNVHQKFNTNINDILLSALAGALVQCYDLRAFSVDLESHGRSERFDHMDLSRTVGWFTSIYPAAFDLTGCESLKERVIHIKETLRNIPDHGLSYGVLKYLCEDQNISLKGSDILFNYLGQFDTGLFSLASESSGSSISPLIVNPYKLIFNAMVEAGDFVMTLESHVFPEEELDQIQACFKEELTQIISFCMADSVSFKTLSDFTFKELQKEEYRKLLTATGIAEDDVEDIYPLTPLQEGILFHSLMDKDSQAYFQQVSMEITGSLDVMLVKKSWQDILLRHDAMRTVFVQELTVPVQVVLKHQDVVFQYSDLRDEASREARLTALKEQDRNHCFHLKTGPLFRVHLVQMGEEDFRFIFSFQHIIMDGWCLSVIFSEFLQIYSLLVQNKPVLLKNAPRYAGFIKWLKEQNQDTALDYWSRYLKNYQGLATLPVLPAAENTVSEERLHYSFAIAKPLYDDILKLTNLWGVTLNSLIQTVWGIILTQYNSVDDVVFGATVSGRPQEISGIDHTVGLFINTIPVRIQAERGQSCCQLAAEVQDAAIESMAFHHTSLVEIQNLLEQKNVLFDHILVFENYPIDQSITECKSSDSTENNSSLLTIGQVEAVEQTHYDFTIAVTPGDDLQFSLTYNPGKYSETLMKQIAVHMEKAFSEIVSDSTVTVDELNIISREERELLLDVFNDTDTDFGDNKTFLDLFYEQVKRAPDAPALVSEDVKLSYRELHEQSGIIANYLISDFDIKQDDLVGVLLNRSDKMIIALLGILKAGAAYVPIDSDYPRERIDYIIENSSPRVVFCDSNYSPEESFVDINKVLVGDGRIHHSGDGRIHHSGDGRIDHPDKSVTAGHLAYVIYTSGSTGRPKGTMIEHGALFNSLNAFNSRFQKGFSPQDRCLSIVNKTFDVSVWEFFLPLAFGAELYIYMGDPLDMDQLCTYIEKNVITFAYFHPFLLEGIAERLSHGNVSLNKLLVGVEGIRDSVLNRYLDINEDMEIINGYGPTEATVCTTLLNYTKRTYTGRNVSIGSPLANTSVLILDKEGRLAPVGVPGELCISGSGLARGYLGDPQLTEEKFVFSPFLPGKRVYKTGDLARWLPEGNIEFINRIDDQVKIRGFRIEPGEIKNTLALFRGVKNAAVIVWEDQKGEKQLVAYYAAGEVLDHGKIRNFLAERLPAYMVPSFYIYLNEIPVTSHGKVDYRALPEPDVSGNSGKDYIAPGNETEEKLAFLWQEILGVSRVGIRDNFFQSGGHSLKATSLISRIKKELEVELELKKLYENPTIESLGAIISGLSRKEHQNIEPVSPQVTYELSNAQKRLWVLDQNEKNSIAYNMPGAYYVKGEFSRDAFMKAYSFMIDRHESLRTVFVTVNGEPRQQILSSPACDIKITDLRGLSDREAVAREAAENNTLEKFRLDTWPLIRFSVLRLEDSRYLILFNMHHIISDGWSMNIFMKEFLDSYASFRKGFLPDLAPLRIQYKDYSAWQNSYVKGSKMVQQKEYWLEKLSGNLPILDLPADFVRPSVLTFQGQRSDFSLSEKDTESLNTLCGEKGVSLFMVLQALIKILFYRYTGQSDIIIGSPVAGRVHEDIEDQIGLYVNTLVFRDDIDGDSSFNENLLNIRKSCLEAFENQDYPFDCLIEELDINHSLSPLFNVFLALHNNDSTAVRLDGLEAEPCYTDSVISKFDMTFNFFEAEGKLFCEVEFNSGLYTKERIGRLTEHFMTLTASVLENPDSLVKDLQIIGEDETSQLLHGFNDTSVEYCDTLTVVDLFEAQAEKTPDSIGVIYEDTQFTYRELNEQSNQLAYYLMTLGVKPDTLVALHGESSAETIIGILGILKAGGAYVPIDPRYPKQRIEYILNDSGSEIILTQEHLAAELSLNNQKVILLDSDFRKREMGSFSTENIPGESIGLTPDNLVYVIYTSGSTGHPKGVMVEHRGVVNLLDWYMGTFSMSEADKILLISALGFDLTQKNIFSVLSAGGILVLPHSSEFDNSYLVKLIEKHNITWLNCAPSAFYGLLDFHEKLLNLKYVFLGGEVIDVQKVREWHEQSSCQLINSYGPTECSDVVSYYNCETLKTGTPPIGKPINNTQIYVLDSRGKLQGIGIPGEIYLGGAGVTRGYHNREELTREKFVQNPFSDDPDSRLYKTGDWGCWLPEGAVDFIGRIDDQVKVRGFRIEPGEIEAFLKELPQIKEAVVLAKKEESENTLLACLVLSKECSSCEKDKEVIQGIRAELKKNLPYYMVPQAFVLLENLPLTPNKKIDKKALLMKESTVCLKREYTAPGNSTEEKLARLWQDILKVNQPGIHDDFFECGGHSLKATTLISRIKRELEVELELKVLFDNPTIEALAKKIHCLNKKEYEAIEPVPLQDSYEVSNGQKRLWVLDQIEENSIAYNMPGAYVITGDFHEEAFQKAVSFVVERHESLRTVFIEDDGEPRQKIVSDTLCHVEVLDLRCERDGENAAGKIAKENLTWVFSLDTGPLIRFQILRLEEARYVMLFNMHHIISDGWSMNILIKELLTCYSSCKKGIEPALAPLRIHYKDYSAWQNRLLKSSEIEDQRAYWHGRLSGTLPVLDLPADNIRPAVQSFQGHISVFSLDADLTRSLHNLCRENGVSLFIMLQALVKTLFYRYTGQSDIILGSPVAGRMHEDTEDQIGLYVNTLALRDFIDGELSFKENLQRVRKNCLEAFDNQDYPLDSLMEDLDITRSLSRSPLFDVFLVLQNNESTKITLEGVELEPYSTGHVISKADMTFSFREREDQIFWDLEYNTDLFTEERIMRLAEHLKALISSVIHNSDSPVKELDILSFKERSLLLTDFHKNRGESLKRQTLSDFPEYSFQEDTTVYILDKNRNLSPVGVAGDLCIGGIDWQRASQNKSEIPQSSYIENPFKSGEMLLLTNERARWMSDGRLEFLGHKDELVKIKGFIIELKEIEKALLLHEAVEEVLACGEDENLRVFYISSMELEALDLRDFLQKSLPDYMVPSSFIHLKEFPLTSSGLIDRKKLAQSGLGGGLEYSAPTNAMEQKLADIWQEILAVGKIGIHDNFFDAGGNSLKAIRLISRIKKEFEIHLELKALFENQSVGALAAALEGLTSKGYERIEPVPLQDSYEVSNAQRRLLILDQLEESHIAYNMPGAYFIQGEFDENAFQRAYSFMIERHESLRTVFITEKGEPRQKILDNPSCFMEIIDLRGEGDVEQSALKIAEENVKVRFLLDTWPLIRFQILRLEDSRYLMLFNMHHIISDGWSLNIFIKELLLCYASFRKGKTPDLAPLRIQYKDYSAWQNRLLKSPGAEKQKEFWLNRLSGSLPVLDLPADYTRPAVQSFQGQSIEFSLSAEHTELLNELCRINDVSLFMMLQALVKTLFYRYTGQSDMIIGSPVAGRSHEDIEDQIGLYVNTLALRDFIDGENTFQENLRCVRKNCLASFDHQDYPLDSILEDLDMSRSLSRSPLFDVFLVLQNNESTSISLEGVELESFPTDHIISKADMTFSFSERDGKLFCGLEYNTDLFTKERVIRLSQHLKTLTSSVINTPDSLVKDLEIISLDERNMLLHAFNEMGEDSLSYLRTAGIYEGVLQGEFTCYILDDFMNLSPLGVPGEIYIGIDGEKEGFTDPSEFSEFSSVESPFKKGEVLVRTYQRARWFSTGDPELLGHRDELVSIRGFQVAFREIEQVLLLHEAVEEAVVLASCDQEERVLWAFYISDSELTPLEVQSFLQKSLPDYMVPSSFISLKEFPLTIHGSIDRNRLAQMEQESLFYKEERTQLSDTERRLAEIWQEILALESVGVDDNFFDMGGSSLHMFKIVTRVTEELNAGIQLKDIFENQTISLLAEKIDKSERGVIQRVIKPVEERDYYPVSSAQKRLYLLDLIQGAGKAYNTPSALIVEGDLDRTRLQDAFDRIIGLQDSLRTSFEMIDNVVVQRVHKKVDFTINYLEAGEVQAFEMIQNWSRPFDLAQAPLLDVTLIKINNSKHILMMDMHHIISDGLSIGILIDSFRKLYNGQSLPSLVVQYKDYTLWQKELLSSSAMEKQETYWLDQYRDDIPVLDLPVDFPRPAVQSFEGARHVFHVEEELSGKLYELANQSNTTLFIVMLAAYNILLSRYSGQEDIVVGSPIAGRLHSDLENIIGMFVNTLALRNRPRGGLSIRDFIEDVKNNTLNAFENQDYQFEELVEKLALKRDLSRNPLFDTMLVLLDSDRSEISLRDLDVKSCEQDDKICKFDLMINIVEGDNQLRVTLEYCTKLFRAETIEKLGGHFLNILKAFTQNQKELISRIDILSPEEREEFLYGFNRTETEYPHKKTVQDLLEEQAALNPGNTALACKEKKLTYDEFNARVNQLARVLRKKGVKPGTIVALIADLSIDLVVGIYGVLKAGGAYLPVDPGNPSERIRYILTDSDAQFLLTRKQYRDKIDFSGTMLELDDENLTSGEKNDNLKSLNSPDDLAYIIYTSGSTGKPKGVMVEHRGLMNYIWWARKTYVKEVVNRFPLYSNIAFDLTVTSTFTPLVSGNTLEIYPQDSHEVLIRKVLSDNKTEVIKLTPVHLKLLQAMDIKETHLKRLIVGGEQLETETARGIHEKFQGNIEIYNEYGPTETVVGCMIYRFDPAKDHRNAVPIGVPVDNAQIYLLDPYLNPVPSGVAGEIYIGGDGVARGYLNKPQLTEEKFVENPFIPGRRMYRTGDLARRLADGNIEFISRIDDQVKIRGFRIELGEIEKYLLNHEEIFKALITAPKIAGGDRVLCAYFSAEREFTHSELRDHLRRELPDYMVPVYFIQLDTFPVTANGKIDHKALPEPGIHTGKEKEYVMPGTGKEQIIAGIWKEVLNRDQISIHENFFEIGGHSLSIVQVVDLINKRLASELSKEIPITAVFQYPTISSLAQYLDRESQDRTLNIEEEMDSMKRDKNILHRTLNLRKTRI